MENSNGSNVDPSQATLIEQLTLQHLEAHPEAARNLKSRHPSDMALSREIKHGLIDRLGGVGNYWIEMVQSAMHWFEPDENSPEFSKFRVLLGVDSGMSADTEHEEKICAAQKTLHQWCQGQERIQQQPSKTITTDEMMFNIGLEIEAGLHEQMHGRNPNVVVSKMRQRYGSLIIEDDPD